tara:strand:- start:992 stop:1963 length:972 start_codon:yes stop_codon:yes gene_type:complete
MVMPGGPTEMRGGRGRAIFGGGYDGSHNRTVTSNKIEIPTLSNAIDFGDIGDQVASGGGVSNSTRGLFISGYTPGNYVGMTYVTLSSNGGGNYFGDLSYVTRDGPWGSGDNTRGVFGGSAGFTGNMGTVGGLGVNMIDYITFATTGDSADFGDLTELRRGLGGCSSPVRTLWGGGYVKPADSTATVDYVITQSRGNAIKFGELTLSRGGMGALSSTTRGIWYGGGIYPGSSYDIFNVIDYITMATDGNAVDFGDTMTANGIQFTTGTVSNKTRGVISGGSTPAIQDDIAYVTITTTGNAVDFGNLTAAHYNWTGCSDSHGGLG